MGCDGIWERYVDDSSGMLQILSNELKVSKDHRKIVESLLDGLLARDTREGLGCDNMTAILIVFK